MKNIFGKVVFLMLFVAVFSGCKNKEIDIVDDVLKEDDIVIEDDDFDLVAYKIPELGIKFWDPSTKCVHRPFNLS